MTLSPEVLSGLRDRLEPCPFCGGAVELTSSKTLGDRLFCIKCPDDSPCVGSGLGIYVVAGQVETAIAAWNRRAALDLSPPVVEEGLSLPRVDGKIAPPVEIGYTNYRGEFAVRCIVPVSFWYGSTDWHPEPQWLVKAWDADKGAERDFAFKDFSPPASPSKPEEPAPVPIPEPQAVAWRYRYEETGEDNEMIWSDWIVVKWKPNRSVFSTKVEIEPLAPLSGGGKVEVTNGVVDAQWQWLCDKDDRSSPVEYPDMALVTRDELGEIITAALSTMGGKP